MRCYICGCFLWVSMRWYICGCYGFVLLSMRMIRMEFWEIWIFGIINTVGMSIAGSWHVDSWGMLGTVATACAHLSQIIVVRYSRILVPHSLVFTTESPEHRNSHGTIVKVNCEATIFGSDVGWITRKAFVFIFSFKNLWIQCVKWSGNIAAICLARLLFINLIALSVWGLSRLDLF